MNEESSVIATYLAIHGANNYDRMVGIEGSFRRIEELWFNDIGLGPFGPRFDIVRESELQAALENENLGILEEDEMVQYDLYWLELEEMKRMNSQVLGFIKYLDINYYIIMPTRIRTGVFCGIYSKF